MSALDPQLLDAIRGCCSLRFVALQLWMDTTWHADEAALDETDSVGSVLSELIDCVASSSRIRSLAIGFVFTAGEHSAVRTRLDSIPLSTWRRVGHALGLMRFIECVVLDLTGCGEDGCLYAWDVGHEVTIVRALNSTLDNETQQWRVLQGEASRERR